MLLLLLDAVFISRSRWRGNPTNAERAGGATGAGGGGAEQGCRRWEHFQHHGELRRTARSYQSSFAAPLVVTEALLPLCQLSGDTDRIFPQRERAEQLI